MSFVVHRVSKSAARYTDAGGREKCGQCRFFVAPRACGKVIGPVSPAGWCKYFSRQVSQQGSTPFGGGPPGATLSLDFMSSGNLPAGITFTRASTATWTDASGVIQTAAVNQPRWETRGLLIEEARTNLLLNSATPGTQGVAVTAQTYTLSFYGTGTITKSGAATGALVGTGIGQRVSQTFTPTAGTVTCTVAGAVTNAQLEAGWFGPTSYIPTTSGAVTRAQDLPIISGTGWFVSPGGTWFAEYIRFNTVAGLYRVLQTDLSGSITPLFYDAAPGFIGQYDGVVQNGTVGTSANVVTKAVTTWAPGMAKLCVNGTAVDSAGTLVTGYGSVTQPAIFRTATLVDATSGYLRRVQYWPRALSNTEMQQVTS